MAYTSLEEFVMTLSQFENVEDILSKYPLRNDKGFVYERLWDLVIKFGCCPRFPGTEYIHLHGNFQIAKKLNEVTSLETYIRGKSLRSGNSGGCVDILMKKVGSNHYICIQCKLNEDEINVNKCDIPKIKLAISENENLYESTEIILAVRDKAYFRCGYEASEFIVKHIDVKNNILDIKDLNICFQLLKKELLGVPFNEIDAKFCGKKPNLHLHFHQHLIVEKTRSLVKAGNKNILWACKCRSGKTYMAAGYIWEQQKNVPKFNVLIVTPVIATISQFTTDLLHKYCEFNKFNTVHIESGDNLQSIKFDNTKNIVIVSKQLLDNYVNDDKDDDKCVESLKRLEFDLIIFDENHFGGTTEYSQAIFKTYETDTTVKIYLTATFSKSLSTYDIPQECQLFWDIEDEKWCKEMNFAKLAEKHGEQAMESVLENMITECQDISKEFHDYNRYPDMHILTNLFEEERYKTLKENIKDTKYGFSMGALFSLNDTETEFNFPNQVQEFLSYISGSNIYKHFPNGNKSIFNRIIQISNKSNNRTLLNHMNFTTQLWFLCFGVGMHIANLSVCLKRYILHDDELKHFDVLILNSTAEYNTKDIKLDIAAAERKAIANKKRGLIILVGQQCSLGISLPLCDVVMLLNDTMSADVIWQMMYRSMTDAPKKTCGFVVDMNPSRVLNTLIEYNIHNKDLSLEDKVKYIVTSNLIHIDEDMFGTKEYEQKGVADRLMTVWTEDPYNRLKSILRRLENEVIQLNETDQKILNRMFMKAHVGDKVNVQVRINPKNEQTMPSGQERKKSGGKKEKEDPEDEDEQIYISLAKDVLPFILPLTCLLTIMDNNNDFMEMLTTIANNEELLEVFNDQTFIWWNQSDIMELIREISTKYIKKDDTTYNIAIQFKMSLRSLIDKPDELLTYIDSCLKPKQKEKQENGEVFTPIPIIETQLDELDAHYTSLNGKSIFTEKHLKWCDFASGMGNFPVVVFMRLNKGLEEIIPDARQRKKHILENMLYMSELIKKNVFVCRQIFDIGSEFKLNLNEGDSLKLDTIATWGVDKFDVVMGNPPYNKGGIRSHTGKHLGEKSETIWPKFIDFSLKHLKDNGYLVQITPLSWLKSSHSLHNVLLEKHVVWLKLWDDSKSKGTINADIPISHYILHNVLNVDKKKTKVTNEIQRQKLTQCVSVYLDKRHSIPLAYHSIFSKLIKFIETHNLQQEYNTKTVKSSGEKITLPLNYNLQDMWAVETYTIKEGVIVKKANEKHPDANLRKIIIANKRGFNGAFIDEGKLCLTGNHKFYITGDDLELVSKVLHFKITDIVCHFTKYGQSFLDNEAFKYIPDIRKLGIDDITEDEFYELIGLTYDEITSIVSM